MIGKNWEKNNVTIAFNVLYAKKEKPYPAHVSKLNSYREKQVIFFNDCKQRRMALPCSKKTISINERNNL